MSDKVYSQTWANDHFRLAANLFTQQPLFWGHILDFYYMNDLWATTTCQ